MDKIVAMAPLKQGQIEGSFMKLSSGAMKTVLYRIGTVD